MVLTTVSKEKEALEKARYLIAQSQQQKLEDESRAIIEMAATIISYQFTQLSKQEIYAMLDINVKETRLYREVTEEAQQESKQKGAVNLICRLLSKRFGSLTEDVSASIAELSFETLEILAEAQLDFRSVTDLESWLDRERN